MNYILERGDIVRSIYSPKLIGVVSKRIHSRIVIGLVYVASPFRDRDNSILAENGLRLLFPYSKLPAFLKKCVDAFLNKKEKKGGKLNG